MARFCKKILWKCDHIISLMQLVFVKWSNKFRYNGIFSSHWLDVAFGPRRILFKLPLRCPVRPQLSKCAIMQHEWILTVFTNGTKTLHCGFANCASLTNSVVGEAYAQGLPQMWCISWLELDYGPRNLAAIFSPLITYIYHISSVISVISHRNHCRHVSASHSGCRIEVHVQVSGANCLIWRHSEPRK